MKARIVAERNLKQDIRLKDLLSTRIEVEASKEYNLLKPCLEIPSKKTYTNFYYRGRIIHIHRLVYSLEHNEKLNKNENICHKCDNRKCSEITHLYKGTAKDNYDDRLEKGRKDREEAELEALDKEIAEFAKNLKS